MSTKCNHNYHEHIFKAKQIKMTFKILRKKMVVCLFADGFFDKNLTLKGLPISLELRSLRDISSTYLFFRKLQLVHASDITLKQTDKEMGD